jgi:hypothetical protein
MSEFERWALTQYNVHLESLTIFPETKNEYWPERIQPTITPQVGQAYHMLVVTYTTGDTVSPSSATHREYVDLYTDQATAHEMGRRIRADLKHQTFYNRHRKDFEDKKLEIVFANGVVEKKDYWPWKGHFENCEEIAVFEVTYAANPKKVTF